VNHGVGERTEITSKKLISQKNLLKLFRLLSGLPTENTLGDNILITSKKKNNNKHGFP
jgi:hypothetical protein